MVRILFTMIGVSKLGLGERKEFSRKFEGKILFSIERG